MPTLPKKANVVWTKYHKNHSAPISFQKWYHFSLRMVSISQPYLPTGKMTIYHYAHYEECRKGKSGSDWFIQQVSMRALWYSPFNLYSVPVKISPLLQYSLIALLPRIEAITNALKYQGVRQKSVKHKTHLLLSDMLINPHGYLHHLDCYV